MYISEKKFNGNGFLTTVVFQGKDGAISIDRLSKNLCISGKATIYEVQRAIELFEKETDVQYIMEETTETAAEEKVEETTESTENTEELI